MSTPRHGATSSSFASTSPRRYRQMELAAMTSPRRPTTSAVFASARPPPPPRDDLVSAEDFSLAEFIARQDAEVQKRQRKLKENAELLEKQFSFTPRLALRPEDDPPSGDLNSFLARLADDEKKKKAKMESLKEKFAFSGAPLIGVCLDLCACNGSM
jgi:hypothetical protein